MFINKVIWTLITGGIVYFIVILINRSLLAKIKDVIHRHQMRKLSYYIGNGVIIIAILVIWIESITSLATFIGIIAAGIVIALGDIILSVAGWLFIVFRQPFKIGDRIELGEFKGDVIDVRLFQFSLLEVGEFQSTGKIVNIPNSYIFRKECTNQTIGFEYVWDEFSITFTFDSNYLKAKEILKNIMLAEDEKIEKARSQIEKAARKFAIHYDKLTSIVYISIEDHGFRLTLRYLVQPRRRRQVRDFIATEALKAIGLESDVTIAYPTYRIIQ